MPDIDQPTMADVAEHMPNELDAAGRPSTRDALARTLTIAVLHYQTPNLLDECLTRVLQAAPGVRTVVVDAGDAEPLPADWPSRRPQVGEVALELVRIENRSYAHAVNTALRLADTDYLAFMNADVYVRPETFANLVYALRAPSVAAVGPLVRDGTGRMQDQGIPYRRYQRRVLRGALAVDVPWLSGCMQIVRLAAVRGAPARTGSPATCTSSGPDTVSGPACTRGRYQVAQRVPPYPPVGGMDETFRFYNEDLEWGVRLASAGWTNQLVATPVVHLGGSATPPDAAFFVEGLRGGYALSKRNKPGWFHAGHRRVGMLWFALMERSGPRDRRSSFRAARKMFAGDHWHQSPFGATLSERNDAFWRRLE